MYSIYLDITPSHHRIKSEFVDFQNSTKPNLNLTNTVNELKQIKFVQITNNFEKKENVTIQK